MRHSAVILGLVLAVVAAGGAAPSGEEVASQAGAGAGAVGRRRGGQEAAGQEARKRPANPRRRRHRRFLDLIKARERAACPYTVRWDTNNDRIPKSIPWVVCNRNKASCQVDKHKGGCCTTVEVTMEVKYTNNETWRHEKFPVACLCLKVSSRRMTQGETRHVD